jgi:prevent-host-death family protein
MEEVGVRRLRDGLSGYLERVRAGETIVVTDRGEPVARIVPAKIPPDIARLVAEGRVTWSGRRPTVPKRTVEISPGPQLSDYISEDRR